MNYYPYMMNIPYSIGAPTKVGLFSSLFKKLNFGSILNGTSKVLNIANQAIPLIKQAKPVINNAKTMFQVMNEFKKMDTVKPIKKILNTMTNSSNNEVANTKNPNSNTVNNLSSTDYKNSLPTFFQ